MIQITRHDKSVFKEDFIMRDRKLYSVEEVLRLVPLSRAGIYAACKKGVIPTISVGRRLFVPSWWVDEMMIKPAKPVENF